MRYTTSPESLAEIEAIEMSKISDAILTEFGFDLAHLAKASRHYDLDANKELQSFRRIVEAQQESEE